MEEENEIKKGAVILNDVGPSAFVKLGLELEETQCVFSLCCIYGADITIRRRIRLQIKLQRPVSDRQQLGVAEQRVRLTRTLAHFRTLQAVYTPVALRVLSKHPRPIDEPVELAPLLLPSALTSQQRQEGCHKAVSRIELKNREGQCDTALEGLRHELVIKDRYITFKIANVRGQGPNTRGRSLLERNDTRISVHAEAYRSAYSAYNLLGGEPQEEWQVLAPSDIVRQKGESEVIWEQGDGKQRCRTAKLLQPGETTREIPWIWRNVDSTDEDVMASKS